MFKLSLSPEYYAPVSIDILDADGVLVKHVFDARYLRLDALALKALHAQMETGEVDDLKLIDRVLKGWRGIRDADNTELAFSPAALARLLLVAGMQQTLSRAYFASLSPTQSANLLSKN